MKIQNILVKSEERNLLINKISLTTAVFFAGIAGYAYFAFLPLFLNSIGFTAGEITFILTFMGVGMALSSWLFGRISDRTGRRKLLFISALLLQIIIFVLLILNNHIIYHCILNFFRGSLLGMRMPASNALFADIVEKSNEKKEMDKTLGIIEVSGTQLSLLNATKSLGWAIGVLGSSFVIAVFGVGSLILFLIITTAISLIFAIPVQDIEKVDNNIKENIVEEHQTERKKAKVKNLLFITVFFRQFGLIPFLQIISLILTGAGIPVGLAGVVIALNPILQVLAMVINGRIIDNPKVSEKIMLAVGFVLSAITLFCYTGGAATGSIVYFILGQISLGFGWGCIYTGAVKYILNRASLERAFYMGIWITDLQVAKIISYQVFAVLWIVLFNNSPELSLPFAAIFPIIGLILTYWL
ncbi:MAG: MFS transporter [Candidatus Thorarchaeota archaeon]